MIFYGKKGKKEETMHRMHEHESGDEVKIIYRDTFDRKKWKKRERNGE